MSKRKISLMSEYNINDGSNSDDSNEDYTLCLGTERMCQVPHESISVLSDGRIHHAHVTITTPASPSKKSKTALNPDTVPLPTAESPTCEIPSQEFSEFDAEYGPSLDKGPRDSCPSDNPNQQWVYLDCDDFLDNVEGEDEPLVAVPPFHISLRTLWYIAKQYTFLPEPPPTPRPVTRVLHREHVASEP
ncbi:hypothetical protein B0H10DRAFT_1947855 [Mycena sp. CBHHK59/15]|nr:hypothetical protein B0H10DRAFT_1947855 [Mycena sp. CBHHK59/15]